MKAIDLIEMFTNILGDSSVLESAVVEIPEQKYQSDEWWQDLVDDIPALPVTAGNYLMVADDNNLFKKPDLVFIKDDLSVTKFIKID